MYGEPVRISRISSLVLMAVLVLAACAGGDELAEEPSPTSPAPVDTGQSPTASATDEGDTASPTPTTEPSDVADAAAQVPAIAATCTLDATAGEPESIRIAYPEGWLVQDGCEWFDPDAESVEQGTEPAVAVSWRVSDVTFERAADVRDEMADHVRFVGARGGYTAVRIEGEASGEGVREEGEPVVMWLVDLDPGTDEQGGTLIGTAHAHGSTTLDVAAYALDRMAGSLLVRPPASDRFVVTRLEGGGTPTTVTWAGDEGCFRLRAGGPEGDVVDEGCVPGSIGSSGLSPVLLEADGATRMLAGVAASPIQRVTVPAARSLSGAMTHSIEGGHVFALPVREPPFDVTGHDYTGEPVASLTFDG